MSRAKQPPIKEVRKFTIGLLPRSPAYRKLIKEAVAEYDAWLASQKVMGRRKITIAIGSKAA